MVKKLDKLARIETSSISVTNSLPTCLPAVVAKFTRANSSCQLLFGVLRRLNISNPCNTEGKITES